MPIMKARLDSTIISNRIDRKTWLISIVVFCIFYFAAPYDVFTSQNLTPTDFQVVSQIKKGFLQENNIFRTLSLFFLCAISIFSLLRTDRRRICITGILGYFILLYLFLAFFSIAWAENFGLTIKKLSVLAAFTLAAIAAAVQFNFRQIINLTFLISMITLIISIVSELVLGTFNPIDPDYRFSGLMYPNIQAWNCVLVLISSIVMIRIYVHRRYFYSLMSIAGLILLGLTRSRTAFASALFAIFVYWLLVGTKRRFLFPLMICICALVMIFFVDRSSLLNQSKNLFFLGRKSPYNATLTGRIPLWKSTLPYLADRPFRGYGYNSFWTPYHVREIAMRSNFFLSNSHNGYLENALSLGLPGAFIWVTIFIIAIQKSSGLYIKTKNIVYAFSFCVLVWWSLNMLLESLVQGVYLYKLLIYVILSKLAFQINGKNKLYI